MRAYILSLYVIRSQMNDRGKINGHTKHRGGNTGILLLGNFASLSNVDQCCSFMRFHRNFRHSQWFAFATILRRVSRPQKGWSAVSRRGQETSRTRPLSSQALNFPESRRRGNLFAHHYAFGRSERRSDPEVPHHFLATAGINHFILRPVAPCNFSFVRHLPAVVFPSLLYIARKYVPLRKWTLKNPLSSRTK